MHGCNLSEKNKINRVEFDTFFKANKKFQIFLEKKAVGKNGNNKVSKQKDVGRSRVDDLSPFFSARLSSKLIYNVRVRA